MAYSAPTPQNLRQLKELLGNTGKEMADLFGLGGDHQWRKYTGGADPREMSEQMLFFGAAALELDAAAMDRIRQRMVSIGARIVTVKEGGYLDSGEEITYRLEYERLPDGQIEVCGTFNEGLDGPVFIQPRRLINASYAEAEASADRIVRQVVTNRRVDARCR